MLEQSIIIYGFVGLGITVVLIGVVFFIKRKCKERKIQKYKNNFIALFTKTKDIRQTMLGLLSIYKKNSAEAKALKAGLYYLNHSILRDYESALNYIEYLLDDDRIDELHKKCIMTIWQERQKALVILDKEINHVD